MRVLCVCCAILFLLYGSNDGHVIINEVNSTVELELPELLCASFRSPGSLGCEVYTFDKFDVTRSFRCALGNNVYAVEVSPKTQNETISHALRLVGSNGFLYYNTMNKIYVRGLNVTVVMLDTSRKALEASLADFDFYTHTSCNVYARSNQSISLCSGVTHQRTTKADPPCCANGYVQGQNCTCDDSFYLERANVTIDSRIEASNLISISGPSIAIAASARLQASTLLLQSIDLPAKITIRSHDIHADKFVVNSSSTNLLIENIAEPLVLNNLSWDVSTVLFRNNNDVSIAGNSSIKASSTASPAFDANNVQNLVLDGNSTLDIHGDLNIRQGIHVIGNAQIDITSESCNAGVSLAGLITVAGHSDLKINAKSTVKPSCMSLEFMLLSNLEFEISETGTALVTSTVEFVPSSNLTSATSIEMNAVSSVVLGSLIFSAEGELAATESVTGIKITECDLINCTLRTDLSSETLRATAIDINRQTKITDSVVHGNITQKVTSNPYNHAVTGIKAYNSTFLRSRLLGNIGKNGPAGASTPGTQSACELFASTLQCADIIGNIDSPGDNGIGVMLTEVDLQANIKINGTTDMSSSNSIGVNCTGLTVNTLLSLDVMGWGNTGISVTSSNISVPVLHLDGTGNETGIIINDGRIRNTTNCTIIGYGDMKAVRIDNVEFDLLSDFSIVVQGTSSSDFPLYFLPFHNRICVPDGIPGVFTLASAFETPNSLTFKGEFDIFFQHGGRITSFLLIDVHMIVIRAETTKLEVLESLSLLSLAKISGEISAQFVEAQNIQLLGNTTFFYDNASFNSFSDSSEYSLILNSTEFGSMNISNINVSSLHIISNDLVIRSDGTTTIATSESQYYQSNNIVIEGEVVMQGEKQLDVDAVRASSSDSLVFIEDSLFQKRSKIMLSVIFGPGIHKFDDVEVSSDIQLYGNVTLVGTGFFSDISGKEDANIVFLPDIAIGPNPDEYFRIANFSNMGNLLVEFALQDINHYSRIYIDNPRPFDMDVRLTKTIPLVNLGTNVFFLLKAPNAIANIDIIPEETCDLPMTISASTDCFSMAIDENEYPTETDNSWFSVRALSSPTRSPSMTLSQSKLSLDPSSISQSASAMISRSSTKTAAPSVSLLISSSTSSSVILEHLLPPLPLESRVRPSDGPVSTRIFSPLPSSESTNPCQFDLCNGFFVPSLAPSGIEIIAQAPDEVVIASSDTQDVVSEIVDLSLADPTAKLEGHVEICFQVPDSRKEEDLCLGFLDESLQPPEWKCEDYCLHQTESGFICGETDHFTNFAILLENGRTGSEDNCNSFSADWVTHSARGDLILILVCLAVVLAISIIIWFLSFFAPCKKLMFGKEGYRIVRARARVIKNTPAAGDKLSI